MTEERLNPTVQMYKTLVKNRQQNKTHYDKSAKNLPELHQGDTVRLQTSKGYDKIGRILADIMLYQKVFVIVEIVRRQLLNVSETYNDDVLYHYNAPVTNEHVNQNPVNLNKGHYRLVEFTKQIQNIVNMVCGFHWITGSTYM